MPHKNGIIHKTSKFHRFNLLKFDGFQSYQTIKDKNKKQHFYIGWFEKQNMSKFQKIN